jgi:glycosyltransferase involved in cell wall biosynthesis
MSRRKYSRKSFQAVIAISNTVKEIFIQTSKYPADDVFVVPSGVDIGVLDAVERDKDFRKSLGGQYLAGGVGKLAPKKNWQFLVRVAAHLAGSGLDIQWVIAGDGNERDALLELACELGVDDRVHLLGFRDDSLRILKSLDVLFFPSVAEGASVTVRECMVLGTPVVAVDAAGTMESLAGHGWSVSDADIEGAAKSVVEALSNQELRNRYVAGARRYAVEHYTYDRTVSGTLEVYRKVLERN